MTPGAGAPGRLCLHLALQQHSGGLDAFWSMEAGGWLGRTDQTLLCPLEQVIPGQCRGTLGRGHQRNINSVSTGPDTAGG